MSVVRRGIFGVLVVAATSACTVATPNKKVGAGIAAGTAITGAAIHRGATGGCWAQCTHGRICDRVSGTCVEAARARASSAQAPAAVTSAATDTKWWEKEPPCPTGTSLAGGADERVYRCVSADGTAQGPVTFLHGNGRKQMEGWNCRGEACRVWTYWDEDGRVLGVEDKGTRAPVETKP